MKIAFVYVSYRPDLNWLAYSLQFLYRNWRDRGAEFIVRLEPDCEELVRHWGIPGVQYHYVKPWPDGYTFQMYTKMTSDQYTDADLLILVDSDLMLLGPAYLDDFLDLQGRIIIEGLSWDRSREAERYWRGCTSRALGLDLHSDIMVRPPFPFWRSTFAKTRERIEEVSGIPFRDFMYSDTPLNKAQFGNHPFKLADYEALNLCALHFEPDKYILSDMLAREGRWPWRLFWSHGDWSLELSQEFDRRLREIRP